MRDAGLDGDIEVVDAEAYHAIHARQVDRDATLERVHVTFERRAGAERHDRRTVTSGRLHHRAHFLSGQREDDDVRLARLVPGLAVTVLLELCGRGGAAVTDARAKIGNESRARVSGKD
jgi:hypothetical protein